MSSEDQLQQNSEPFSGDKDPLKLSFIKAVDDSFSLGISFRENMTEEEKYIASEIVLRKTKEILDEKLKNISYTWREIVVQGKQ